MTDLIKQARELCEKATPGPWIRSKFGLNILTHDSEISTATQKYTGPSAYVADQMAVLDANAAFIVRSRTLVPELCDALEKAEEQNKQLLREVCKLACESVEREKKLAKLEAEVEHAITATRWIPVAERLPDYDVPVLVTYLGFTDNKPYSDGIARWVLEMNGYTGGWEWTLDGGEVEVTITHWMPLPEPPEDKP